MTERKPVREERERREAHVLDSGYSGLLGFEIERKGNVYIEARLRRERCNTVEIPAVEES